MTRNQSLEKALEKALVIISYYDKSDDYDEHYEKQRDEVRRGIRKYEKN